MRIRAGRVSLVLALATHGACVGGDGRDDLAETGSSSGAATGETGSSGDATGATATSSAASTGDESTTGGGEDGWHIALEVGENVGAFYSVWGTSTDALYVVGGQPLGGGASVGAMFRHAGGEWTQVDVPEGAGKLNWVTGVGDARFVVGDLGTILRRTGDDDATPWALEGCDTVLPLWGVWGAADDDVWVVGGDGFMRPPVLCHWDGAQWSEGVLPEPSFETFALFKIWGAAADDIWAVGDDGWLVHYDGIAWTEVPSGTDFDLIALWGTGPDEILAVGGRASAMLVRRDAAAWTPSAADALLGLNGIWMDQDGTSWVVGVMGTAGRVAPGATEIVVEDPDTLLTLHATFSAEGERLFAVGGSIDAAPPFVGVIVERAI
jgi:hypothetical protein